MPSWIARARRTRPSRTSTPRTRRQWLERIDAERDNVRAALDRALDTGDPHLALELARPCCRFWWVRDPSARAGVDRAGIACSGGPAGGDRRRTGSQRGGCACVPRAMPTAALHSFRAGARDLPRELGDRHGDRRDAEPARTSRSLRSAGKTSRQGRRGGCVDPTAHLGNKQELALSLARSSALARRGGRRAEGDRATRGVCRPRARERRPAHAAILRGGQPRRSRARRRRPGGSRLGDAIGALAHAQRRSATTCSLVFSFAVRAIVVLRSGDEQRAGHALGCAERLDVESASEAAATMRHKYEELLGRSRPAVRRRPQARARSFRLERASQLGLGP